MAPNKRRLGTTDLEITTVGFGAWAIGGGGWEFGWGLADDAGSVAAIQHALRRGVNWIDTAAIYGLGHSEEIVGRALREIPASERPFVFTKGGMIPDGERSKYSSTRAAMSSVGISSVPKVSTPTQTGLVTPIA